MKTALRAIILASAILVMAVTSMPAVDWTLDAALKQIDKASKSVDALTGEATITDHRKDAADAPVSGKVSILTNGRLRFEMAGDTPKTTLCVPGKLYLYEPGKSTVTEYSLEDSPGKLAPYALVGFSPLGSDMKKRYLVTLVEDTRLDDRSVLLLELTPLSDQLRGSISKIQLWIDQANWFPVQQRIHHSAADTHLTIRYSNLSRNDNLDDSIFDPKWPKHTIKLKGE